MTRKEIRERLHELLQREFPALARLREDENIWDAGAVDSMSLFTLVDRIETTLGFRFPGQEMTEQTLSSIGSIAAYLTEKLGDDG